ncbi:MAG: SH3 domain-containing protein [Rhizobiaceae bacterium]|jgi:SH3-like domain-containing protein|nr:SH3 domain-containing protein [Rhizobiaceae bacterium]
MLFRIPVSAVVNRLPRLAALCLAAALAGAVADSMAGGSARAETVPGQDGVDAAPTGAVGSATKGARLQPGVGGSGLPLPRFASLKSANVNLRVGPGKEHPILWTYVKAGLPVEIVLEFDTWRKIRDSEGVEGWVYQSMLSGRRTATVEASLAARPDGIEAIIQTSLSEPENLTPVYAKPDAQTRVIAKFEAGLNVEVLTCDGSWCSVQAGDHAGWVAQASLWGVYPNEQIDD